MGSGDLSTKSYLEVYNKVWQGTGLNQGEGHITGREKGLIARVGEEACHSGRKRNLMTTLG